MSEEQKEQIRAAATVEAIRVAKEAGTDWNSLPLNEKEARMLTQLHKMEKK
jgi:predicted secreted hydrolase